MSFFEENNIKHYRLYIDKPRAGVKIYYFLILKKNGIDQSELSKAVDEYFDNDETFPDFLYLYAPITNDDGTIEIFAVGNLDDDLDDDDLDLLE